MPHEFITNPKSIARRGAGRPKGSANKTTLAAKEMIQAVADKLGGLDRMASWANEDPLNERAFWASIYPKLLPLQVTGENGKSLFEKIEVVLLGGNAKG